MQTVVQILLVLLALFALLLAIGWVGLRWKPGVFPRCAPQPEPPPAPAEWPPDLPAPVRRALGAVLPNGPQPVSTAVISGRAVLRIKGLPLRARFRFIHEAGRNYRHQIEATWFGWPILKVNESLIDGYPRMALGPLGTFEGTSTLRQAATLGLWAESIWLPSLLATDSRLRWQVLDDLHVRLFVPFEAGDEQLLIAFDPATGRIASLDAQRYRDADEDAVKLGWHCAVHEYGDFGGVMAPRQASLQWSDMRQPWAEWTVEEVVYNADVSGIMRPDPGRAGD